MNLTLIAIATMIVFVVEPLLTAANVENQPFIIENNRIGGCESGEFEPYPGDYSKFYQCVNGQMVEFSCPPGLEWIIDTEACAMPKYVYTEASSNNEPLSNQRSIETNEIEENFEIRGHLPTLIPSLLPANDQFKVIICYFTNWSFYRQGAGKYLPKNIDPNLCTHINYAFAVLDPTSLTMKVYDTWADIDNKLYELVTANRQKGIKVLISIGGWNDSQRDKYDRLLTDASARRSFAAQAVEFIQKYVFDGLDLDLEYPGCWQGNCGEIRSEEKEGFVQLIQELSNAFEPSAGVSAAKRVIDVAYDVPKLSQYLDFISIMTYDYHGSWDRRTGHNAPLHSNDSSDNFNVDISVHYWIQSGAESTKLVMGIPTYAFTLANPNENGFNAPTYGAEEAGSITRAAGMLSYYEICEKTKKNGWKVVRDTNIGPYAFSGNQWVSFDDVEVIRITAKLISEWKLGGGMIWALDLDDFTGSCGCGEYPLLAALNQELRGIRGDADKNCT